MTSVVLEVHPSLTFKDGENECRIDREGGPLGLEIPDKRASICGMARFTRRGLVSIVR